MRIRRSAPVQPGVPSARKGPAPWWIWLGLLAPLIGLASAAVAIVKSLSDHTDPAPPAPREDPQSVARVTQALSKLEATGCTYVVTSPRSVTEKYTTTLEMKAGGACVHVLASAPASESLDVRIVTPLAKTIAARAAAGQVVDLEHCPDESGSRNLDVTASPAGPFAVALVDCAPAREKYRDDRSKNGLDRVSRRLEALRAKGCREVLFAPKTVADEQSFTATLARGAGCAVVVAASSDDNPLSAELRTPLGRVAAKPDPAPEIQLSHCATTSGPHPLTIRPKTGNYYTVGAVNCPRAP